MSKGCFDLHWMLSGSRDHRVAGGLINSYVEGRKARGDQSCDWQRSSGHSCLPGQADVSYLFQQCPNLCVQTDALGLVSIHPGQRMAAWGGRSVKVFRFPEEHRGLAVRVSLCDESRAFALHRTERAWSSAVIARRCHRKQVNDNWAAGRRGPPSSSQPKTGSIPNTPTSCMKGKLALNTSVGAACLRT